MTIIFNQYNEATRGEIALGTSYEDNFEAEELIKFLRGIYIVYNITNNGNIHFGSQVIKITEYHFWPTPFVRE